MLFHTSLCGETRSYWQGVVHSCSVLHCAAVSSIETVLKIFDDRAAQWSTEHISLPIDLICPHSDVWNSIAVKQLKRFCAFRYDLSYWQSAFYNAIWFLMTETFDISAQWSNWQVSMLHDPICPAADSSFSLRYDLSRQMPNLSVNWVNL